MTIEITPALPADLETLARLDGHIPPHRLAHKIAQGEILTARQDGQITGWLAARVAPGQVVAVDFAEAMLAQARRKQLAAEFRRADVCRDPLGQRCFDVVLCFHSFPHFRDQAAALRNLASALRPGGRLMVMHLAGSAQINAFHDEVGGAVAGDHLPSCADWECLLAQAGLQIRQFLDHDDLFLLVAGS